MFTLCVPSGHIVGISCVRDVHSLVQWCVVASVTCSPKYNIIVREGRDHAAEAHFPHAGVRISPYTGPTRACVATGKHIVKELGD